MATGVTFRAGQAGRRFEWGTVTLASGTGTLATSFRTIDSVMVTETQASTTTDNYSFTTSGGTVTVNSDNASNAETVHVWVFGF